MMRVVLAFAFVLLTGSAFAQTWGCYDACTPEYHHAPGYNYAPGCDYSSGYAYAPLSGYYGAYDCGPWLYRRRPSEDRFSFDPR
jgi:hypothetical protein